MTVLDLVRDKSNLQTTQTKFKTKHLFFPSSSVFDLDLVNFMFLKCGKTGTCLAYQNVDVENASGIN